MTAPTPRDLFGRRSVPTSPDLEWWFNIGRRGAPSGLSRPTTPNQNTGHRMHDNGQPHWRPAYGYGGEGPGIAVGMRWLTISDDRDVLGWTGRPLLRPTRRAKPEREPMMNVTVDIDHPAAQDERAVCASMDPDMFVTQRLGGLTPFERAARQAACDCCPIRQTCLDWALNHDEEGFWGGTTKAQRRKILRERKHEEAV